MAILLAQSGLAEAKQKRLLPRIWIEQPQDLEINPYRAAQYEEDQDDPSLDGGQTDGVIIRPREAARIAKNATPGYRVLKVKLLPSGIYAVTLRGEGRLTRVMVDGRSGEIL